MSDIRWEASLATGVGVIDEQHKQLIGRIRDLAEAVEKSQGPTAVASTLSFLAEYTNFHFMAEEGFMLAQAFPGLEGHKKEHEEFRAILHSMDIDFETDGASAFLADQINRFLITWLFRHIRQVDTQFGKFVQDKGVELK